MELLAGPLVRQVERPVGVENRGEELVLDRVPGHHDAARRRGSVHRFLPLAQVEVRVAERRQVGDESQVEEAVRHVLLMDAPVHPLRELRQVCVEALPLPREGQRFAVVDAPEPLDVVDFGDV